jgi:hypothetical protein
VPFGCQFKGAPCYLCGDMVFLDGEVSGLAVLSSHSVKSRRPLHHGTVSPRVAQPQRRAELADIERFAQERGVNKVPEAERDERLAAAGAVWHSSARGFRVGK